MTETSDIWTGKASSYDRVRPTPPPALLDLLTQLIGMPHPALVVDLGSGTGLSTAIWGERAERVIGIEPNADMRKEAIHNVEDHPYAAHIEYREGVAHQTGLPDGCADIVTAAQSFHWMEPTSTLAEIARILRPGGLFAAYDYDSPPAIHWELDRLAQEVKFALQWSLSGSAGWLRASRSGRRTNLSTPCARAATSASPARCCFIISSKETRHGFLR